MTGFLLAVLATFRLARMLAMEEGPKGLFEAIRSRFDPLQQTWLGRGLNCPLCLGFWIALVVTALLPFSNWQTFVVTWWAIAGAQVLLQLWSSQWNA